MRIRRKEDWDINISNLAYGMGLGDKEEEKREREREMCKIGFEALRPDNSPMVGSEGPIPPPFPPPPPIPN